jgi:acyl-CoA synthetase (AMP-forming)/AMP-acid ligase II
MSNNASPRIAYDSLALGRLVVRHARYRPGHLAVVAPSGTADVRLTWRGFDALVNRTANALAARGVRHGDRVATLLPNGIELLTLFWACAKLGAAIVPLSTLLNGPGIASLLTDARARLLVAAAERGPVLDAVLAGGG